LQVQNTELMPIRRQHINNIAAQLELQKAEAYKLIDDLALLKECSMSISISVEALKEAEDEVHTGWNQTRAPSPPYSPSIPTYSLTSYAYSPTSAPYGPLPTPPESPRHHAFRSPFESDDKSQGNHKRPRPNPFCWVLANRGSSKTGNIAQKTTENNQFGWHIWKELKSGDSIILKTSLSTTELAQQYTDASWRNTRLVSLNLSKYFWPSCISSA